MLSYIADVQHARASREAADWDAVRRQLAPDVVFKMASPWTDERGAHVSMVCHIFSVANGVITGVRMYRNDNGLPVG